MSELHEIFEDAVPATVFLCGSAISLILCAVAAFWLRRKGAAGSGGPDVQ